MTDLEKLAWQTAERCIASPGPHFIVPEILAALRQAVGNAEDAFIDELFVALKAKGINCENWDGDESPVQIIADGVASALAERDALLAEMANFIQSMVHHQVYKPEILDRYETFKGGTK